VTRDEKEALLLATRFAFRRLGNVAGIVGAVVLAYMLRGVLVPLFLAFLLAYALHPMVERAERWGVPRTFGAIGIMIGLATVTIGLLTFVIPYFINEFVDAAAALPFQLSNLWRRLEPWAWQKFHVRLPHTWGEISGTMGEQIQSRGIEVLQSIFPTLFGTFSRVVVLLGSLIIPIFTLYLLMDFKAITTKATQLVPRRYASIFNDIFLEVHETLSHYIRGQFTASLVLAAYYATVLWLLGIRLAIPIGILTGLFAFIPYLGFSLGLFMAVLMSILDWHGTGPMLGVFAVMLLGQILDGLFVTPRIVGGSVGLKPIEVLLTMMGAATLFGFWGVLLAVPIGAVVKILISRASTVYLKSSYYKGIPGHSPLSTPYPSSVFDSSIPPPPSIVAPSLNLGDGQAGMTPIPATANSMRGTVIPPQVAATPTTSPVTTSPFPSGPETVRPTMPSGAPSVVGGALPTPIGNSSHGEPNDSGEGTSSSATATPIPVPRSLESIT
jgi:predicted PurR-regulated permease PerM